MPDSETINVKNALPVSIASWLSVTNAAKAVKFYKEAFGAIVCMYSI